MKYSKKLKENNRILTACLLITLLLISGALAAGNTALGNSAPPTTTTQPPALSAKIVSEENYQPIAQTTETVPKASIGIDPRKQTSVNGHASYNITLKAFYLPDTNALQTKNYVLKFEPKSRSITGYLEVEKITLQPGEKKTIGLEVQAESMGDHEFTVVAVDEEGNKIETTGILSVVEYNREPSQKARLDLAPEKQYTETGSSEYILTLYRPLEKQCYSNTECANIYAAQTYTLKFASEQGQLSGEFGTDSVSLFPGEKKSVPLLVETDKKGTYVFKVHATTADYEISAKGLLVYGKEPAVSPTLQTQVSSTLLNGEGFATNKDQSEGAIIYLYLLGDEGNVRGKMVFDDDTYAVKGAARDVSKLDFSIFKTEDGGFDNSLGEFSGDIRRFDRFTLLEGALIFQNQAPPDNEWTLRVISKQNSVFENKVIVVQSDTPVTKTINKEEVVTIRQGRPTETGLGTQIKEVYIVPEKIERKKIFGIIPNPWGNKHLKVKLVEGDKITEEKVKEFGTSQIGDYEVSIGSLENEDAIEVSITKTTEINPN